MRRTRIVGVAGGLAVIALAGQAGRTQQSVPPSGTEWPMYRHDYAGTGYSPLAQITTKNVSSLREVWSYRLPEDANSQATPIVVNGLMFLPAGDRIVALDPATGAERWRHRAGHSALAPWRRLLVW